MANLAPTAVLGAKRESARFVPKIDVSYGSASIIRVTNLVKDARSEASMIAVINFPLPGNKLLNACCKKPDISATKMIIPLVPLPRNTLSLQISYHLWGKYILLPERGPWD